MTRLAMEGGQKALIQLYSCSQISMDLYTVPNNGRLDFQLDVPVDRAPCNICVTVRNQYGNTHTEVVLGKLKRCNVIEYNK